MTDSFKDLMAIFNASAHGTLCPEIQNADWKTIRSSAIKHGVWDIIFANYKRLYLKNAANTAARQFIASEGNAVLSRVCRDIRQKEALKVILNEFKENGIRYALLKGYFFSQLYAEPDFRMSGDIDLLVNEENEERAVAILEKNEYVCAKRLNTEYHRECRNPKAGLIELHVSLYDSYCKEIWFNNMVEGTLGETVEFTTKDGYRYTTLAHTENYLYCVLHFIKHFIGGGISIRQLMDIMLMAARYKKDIRTDVYVETMKKLKFDTLMDVMTLVAVRYLGFGKDELFFCNSEEPNAKLIEQTVSIIESDGMFGKFSTTSDNFSEIYSNLLLHQKGSTYWKYLGHSLRSNGILQSLFVDAAQLSDKYAYAKKHKILLPAAWIHRIFNRLCILIKNRHETNESDKIELLKATKVIR